MAKFVLTAFADEAGKPLSEQIAALKRNNIRYIEPRMVDGINLIDKTEDEIRAIKAELDAGGIRVSSLGSPIGKYPIHEDFAPHYEKFLYALKICEILETKNMRVFDFYCTEEELPEVREEMLRRMNMMLDAAEKAGVSLCLENESGIYSQSPAGQKDALEALPRIRGIFDAANYIMTDGDVIEGIDATLPTLEYVHIKDASYDEKCILPAGEGDGQIGRCLLKVHAAREGEVFLTLEPHLRVFDGYVDIDKRTLKGKHQFKNSTESFDYAVAALKKTLATVGFVENAEGDFEPRREEDKVRFGIVGVGNMGTGHARNLMDGKIRNGRLTAVADTNPAKLDALRQAYGDKIAYFATATEMFESGLIDCVEIAVPHYDHPSIAIDALKHGIHAVVEKPAGVYTKQVEEMLEFAKTSDKLLGIMFNQRTNPCFRKMKEIVASGQLGEIKRTNWIITDWYRTQDYYDSGAWRATWAGEGGGVLYNQAPHQLDLFQWIVGMTPSRVHAFCHFGKWHTIEVEDDVTAYMEYPNGATGVFITTTGDTPGSNRFEITGTLGKLVYEDDRVTFTRLLVDEREHCKTAKGGFVRPKSEEVAVRLVGENTQHIGILNNVANAILGYEELYAKAEEGIHGVALANAMHLSAWENRTVDMPVDGDAFLRHLEERIATSTVRKDNVVDKVDGSINYGESQPRK